MNLRTVSMWVLYDPIRKQVIACRQFKYEIEGLHNPAYSVIFRMKGHYVRTTSTSTKAR